MNDDITTALQVVAALGGVTFFIDTVAEAQDGRIRKGTHTGDPPDKDEPR